MPEMPALPDADWLGGAYAQAWRAATVRGWPKENAARYTVPLFTADQMQAYAAAAVAAEREAIIALLPGGEHVDPQWVADAIRARCTIGGNGE